MSDCNGLDREDFEDMSADMMANQLDLFITTIPSLPDPEREGVPNGLKKPIRVSREFSEEVREAATQSTEGMVEKYFKFLDSDGSGMYDFVIVRDSE